MNISKLISSISMSIPRFRSSSTSTSAAHLPITRNLALIPATASLPMSEAPWPRPAAPAVPMAATQDLPVHRCPSLPRGAGEVASAAGIASSLPPPAGSVELTSIVLASGGGGADVIEKSPNRSPSPSRGDTSSGIMDNPQCTSSFDSSTTMDASDVKNYHQNGNTILLGQGMRNNLGALENRMTNGQTVTNKNIASVDTSRDGNVSNEIEKKMKGLLGSIHTTTERVHTGVLAIFALSGGCLLTLIFLQGSNNKHMEIVVILTIGNTLGLLISCFVLSPRVSFLKESEPIDSVKFGELFIWLVIALSVYYCEEFFEVLGLALSFPVWLAWTLRSIVPCLIVPFGCWWFYIRWPKIVEETKKVMWKQM